ncbi:MAG: DUF934 domain-containing protein [Pseudomonadota bacterium]
MKLLKFENGSFIEAEGFAAHGVAGLTISFEEWRDNGYLNSANALVIPNHQDLGDLDADFSAFETIILEFPTFKDGRAYSQARRLRDQYGFRGDIAACGDIARDQVLFMLRAGVNVFEVPSDLSRAFEDASREFSLFYQHAADRVEPVWRLRRERAIAA